MIDKLKRWLNGDADWKAEQELDRLGKKDPFLADAVEGYRSIPEADHADTVEALKRKLRAKNTQKRAFIPFRSMIAVAAVIGAVSLFLWLQKETRGPDIAIVEATQAEPRREVMRPAPSLGDKRPDLKSEKAFDVVETEREVEISGTATDELIAFEAPTAASSSPELKVDPSNIEAGIIEEADLVEVDAEMFSEALPPPQVDTFSEVVRSDAYEFAEAEADEGISEVEDQAIASAGNEEKNREAAKKSMSATPASPAKDAYASTPDYEKELSGKVIDLATNEGLIGASVFIKDTDIGGVTDIDGNFTLRGYNELPWTLVVSYTGYREQEIVINNLDESLQIEMDDEGMVLEEVVVTSGRISKRQKAQSSTAAATPKPRKGFKKIKRYIRKKMNYPELAKQNKVEGSVTVRFYIDGNGKPTQLKVLNSLGSGCDEEAIRLIEEGPEWTPINTWATYNVDFEL